MKTIMIAGLLSFVGIIGCDNVGYVNNNKAKQLPSRVEAPLNKEKRNYAKLPNLLLDSYIKTEYESVGATELIIPDHDKILNPQPVKVEKNLMQKKIPPKPTYNPYEGTADWNDYVQWRQSTERDKEYKKLYNAGYR